MHLYADISSHGFGHLAQTAPVLDALRRRLPALRLTVRCGLPRERVAQRLAEPFTHLAEASDFGLVMDNAVDVDRDASLAAYRAFHHDWDARVEAEAARLAALQPDLVLANVSYLALAAARRAGIPAVAMGSLNWAAITAPYFRDVQDFAPILEQMTAAYRGAEAFLRLTPGLAMPELPGLVRIGPIAQPGKRRRQDLPVGHLVLVAMGGLALRLPPRWPRLPGVTWLVPRDTGLVREDVRPIEDTGMSVSDLIASVDAVLTKAGYGTFVEAAACGTPLLYVRRPDWPEESALVAWQREVSRALPIERDAFEQGRFGPVLRELLAAPRPPVVALSGVAEAAEWLATRLSRGAR